MAWARAEEMVVSATHLDRIAKGAKYRRAASTRLTELALQSVFGLERLLCHAPLEVSPRNATVPALVVLRRSFDEFDDNPFPADVELLVEISDVTLRLDLTLKAGLYARAGIPEYWVLDLPNRRLNVFRNPSGDAYQTRFIVDEAGSIAPLAQPDRAITIASVLP